jgi:methyl-accepting chemotaxis protein
MHQEIQELATNATQEIEFFRRETQETVHDAVDMVRFVQNDLARVTKAFERTNMEAHSLRSRLEEMSDTFLEIQYSVSMLNESYSRSSPVGNEKTFQAIFDAIKGVLAAQAF